MPNWLLNRLFNHGHQPTPRFAFQGTVNWMRALSMLADSSTFSHQMLQEKYSQVQRRKVNPEADTLVFEMLVMSLHNLSSLASFDMLSAGKYEVVRSAIVSWYYSTYYASKAMIAACSASNPQTHSKTAKVWQSDIVANGLAVEPFSFMLSNAATKTVESEIAVLRQSNTHDLNIEPKNSVEARGAAISYLKGTAEYVKWQVEEDIKSNRAFRNLNVTNFRSAAARKLRDDRLQQESVNYLVQAFRYRGKAHYRDSIYLSYGVDQTQVLGTFIGDLRVVAERFLTMASFYVARRVEKGTWQDFVADINESLNFHIPIDLSPIS